MLYLTPCPGLILNSTKLIQCLKRCSASVKFTVGDALLAVAPEDVDTTMEAIKAAGETPYVIGNIEAGEKGVTLC